ncbi:MAG: leucine-rich repeat domain-containing protein, partial [Lachnospiraceae bacterium]|nr:leucine-rich repeat domain-containing protein [Lachnospiraceae bacterium]
MKIKSVFGLLLAIVLFAAQVPCSAVTSRRVSEGTEYDSTVTREAGAAAVIEGPEDALPATGAPEVPGTDPPAAETPEVPEENDTSEAAEESGTEPHGLRVLDYALEIDEETSEVSASLLLTAGRDGFEGQILLPMIWNDRQARSLDIRTEGPDGPLEPEHPAEGPEEALCLNIPAGSFRRITYTYRTKVSLRHAGTIGISLDQLAFAEDRRVGRFTFSVKMAEEDIPLVSEVSPLNYTFDGGRVRVVLYDFTPGALLSRVFLSKETYRSMKAGWEFEANAWQSYVLKHYREWFREGLPVTYVSRDQLDTGLRAYLKAQTGVSLGDPADRRSTLAALLGTCWNICTYISLRDHPEVLLGFYDLPLLVRRTVPEYAGDPRRIFAVILEPEETLTQGSLYLQKGTGIVKTDPGRILGETELMIRNNLPLMNREGSYGVDCQILLAESGYTQAELKEYLRAVGAEAVLKCTFLDLRDERNEAFREAFRNPAYWELVASVPDTAVFPAEQMAAILEAGATDSYARHLVFTREDPDADVLGIPVYTRYWGYVAEKNGRAVYSWIQSVYDAMPILEDFERIRGSLWGCILRVLSEETGEERAAGIDARISLYEETEEGGVSWTVSEGVLRVSGTGPLQDYERTEDVPWYGKRAEIRTILVEEGVTAVGRLAFAGCMNAEQVLLPDSLERIGEGAFDGCSALRMITVPRQVSVIDQGAFRGTGLSEIRTDPGNACYQAADGVLFDRAGASLIRYPMKKAGESYTVPEGVTMLGEGAFEGCSALTEITLADSVFRIGASAFASCSGIREILLGPGVLWVDASAFQFCSALESIEVSAENPSFRSVDGVLFDKGGYTLICYPAGKTDRQYMVPARTFSIGGKAFFCNRYLEELDTGNGVWNISDDAVQSCTALKRVVFGRSILINGSFQKEPGYYMPSFEGCEALESFDVDPANTNLCARDGVLYFRDEEILFLYPRGKRQAEFTVPDTVGKIAPGAFSSCRYLQAVRLGENVSVIGARAFENCSALKIFDTGALVTRIGAGTFKGCTALTQAVIRESVEEIGDEAFFGCTALTMIRVPEHVKTVGDAAFGQCTHVTKVSIGNGVLRIGKEAFAGLSALTELELGDGLLEIGDGAFRGCTALPAVSVPDSVLMIGDEAFQNCAELRVRTLGEGILRIGRDAFAGCP